MSQEQRKLAAIMFTDMVGFTALGQRSESLSLVLLEEQRKLIRSILARHRGTEIKTIGDAFLVEFSSALEAVRCAYDIQRATREFNISLPSDQRLNLRIGVHLGDVIKSGEDISGDAVNVASRIEPLAEEGGVCLSRQIYDQVQNKFELPLVSIGLKTLKNVLAPLEVYKVLMPWETGKSVTSDRLDTKRIAVLPFTNMSPDPNDSYFADGITEEIISTVSSVGGLSVISRTSVMGYKGTTKKLREIGGELEVGSVLEGSIRKYGNKIRIATQLIDVNKDTHVWAKSYDRELDDVFAIQSDIAKQVADALRVRILSNELDRISKKPTEDTAAYTLYLKGRQHLWKRGIEDTKKAAECFESATKEDPSFALGYVGLADSFELLSANWEINPRANHEKAKKLIAKALELEPDLAEAHTSKGLTLSHDLKLREAEKEFQRAIELKPNYASAHQWYSHILTAQERWDEAQHELDKALELDPFSQIINLNYASYYAQKRDYVSALVMNKRAVELAPDFPIARFSLANTYGKLRMFPEARNEMQAGLKSIQDSHPYARDVAEAMLAYFDDDKAKVLRLLPELEKHYPDPFGADATTIAGIYFYLGDKEKGFEWLQISYEKKEYHIIYIRTEELLDSVRDDPRYLDLLKKLELN